MSEIALVVQNGMAMDKLKWIMCFVTKIVTKIIGSL